eukprot:TRINITY_DN1379_c0_g1_i1.p1 TRINITY_DN1379_c0_g1~~TRINITY_DN1379_c0_g1_i1.p1  ORF type:complete len:143 (+),score=7.83 TRINITY_DN1379_c0_g1_i1:95-523(+)
MKNKKSTRETKLIHTVLKKASTKTLRRSNDLKRKRPGSIRRSFDLLFETSNAFVSSGSAVAKGAFESLSLLRSLVSSPACLRNYLAAPNGDPRTHRAQLSCVVLHHRKRNRTQRLQHLRQSLRIRHVRVFGKPINMVGEEPF